jgi:hypothetical protein
VYPLGSIALLVTFGTEENFRTENVVFDVAEVNLPFNAIIGRPTLYWFMAIAHYGYLVLKMPSTARVLTVQGDRAAALAVVEKLHAQTMEGGTPRPLVPRRLPRCRSCNHPEQTTSPSRSSSSVRVPPRPLTLRVIWRKNRNSRSSPSSRQMPMYSHGSRRRCLGSLGR